MTKSELEQKYNDLEKRVSKMENYLRDKDKRRERISQLMRESQAEFNQGIFALSNLQEEFGDEHCSS